MILSPPRSRKPWLERLIQAALALLACCTAAVHAEVTLEQSVKAAFLFNFAKFVAWPDAKFSGPTAPILFCVLQGDALVPALDKALAGKAIDNHSLVPRIAARPEEFRDCHVAYLGGVDEQRLPAALAALRGAGVLTVYEAHSTQHDGVVRFYLEDRKVRFEINESAAQRQRLQLSSQLLNIASVVRD